MDIYLEIGKKRVFANAVDWPGYSRIGKSEDDAIENLLRYAKRYAKASVGFKPDKTTKVVERVIGGTTTDFGAPGQQAKIDERDITPQELKRQIKLLRKAWTTFDAAAEKHAKTKLRAGPRGGGRSVPKMVDHVMGADRAYLSALGGTLPKGADLRVTIVEALERRVAGEELPPNRRKKPLWAPRYFVRRSAWHALDHLWEIEDRAT
jgi:hypothetical protein